MIAKMIDQQVQTYRGGVITEFSIGMPELAADGPESQIRWRWSRLGLGFQERSLESLKDNVDRFLDAPR
jgi:hypothetical protein